VEAFLKAIPRNEQRIREGMRKLVSGRREGHGYPKVEHRARPKNRLETMSAATDAAIE
jgi:hypothetical protein